MDLVPQVPETHRATKHTTLAHLSAPKERFHLANWYGGLFCKYEPHWIEQKTNSFALLNVMLVLTIPCTATESRNDATTSGGGISHVRAPCEAKKIPCIFCFVLREIKTHLM
jgi:hypothetical protein